MIPEGDPCWPAATTETQRLSAVTVVQQNHGEQDDGSNDGFKQHARASAELHGQVVDIADNITYVAKISKTRELQTNRTKIMLGRVEAEAPKLKRETNFKDKDGIKQISRATGDDPANQLPCVKRDRGVADGGNKGGTATNLQDVEAIVNGMESYLRWDGGLH